ncbi:DUF3040 domain-containing protein [Streptomyces sp. NPDC052079]|uniref:DUF3040 domain-containing protein n=1 Tax=Streptomyces sp. NPDC052079 TaxID=3155526 RepID=UPI00341FF012
MPHSHDARPADLAARLEHEEPRPREYRRTGAWWALVIGVAMLIAGVLVPDGLLIAAGLVLSGIAAQLLDPNQRPRPRHPRRC